jgi:uncharacterized caspase-like protein
MVSISRISQCLILLALISVEIFGNPAVPQQSSPENRKTLHILAIGISKYQYYKANEVPTFAAKDAREFTASLQGVARTSFDSITTRVLVDEEATRAAIGSAIDELRAAVQPQDTLVFFYSGHGMTRTLGLKREEQFYLVPNNFNPALGNSELSDKGIAGVLLQSWFLSVRAQHQFIVLNSSKSGRGFEGFVSRAEADNKFLGPMARRDFAVLFNNTGSYELNSVENGLLPYVLIEALKGDALTADRVVTAKELIDYVEQNARVVLHRSANTATRRFLSRLTNFGLPSNYWSGEDFPLGSKPGGAQANTSGERFRERSALIRADRSLRTASQALAIDPRVSVVQHALQDDVEFILPPECAALSEVRESRGTSRKGKDHALLFGTDLYDNWAPLVNPTLDATAIAAILNTRFGFETEVVKNASKKCISQFLAKYSVKKYGDDEQLLIFFAGHGSYKSNYDGFLIARDSEANNLDPGGDSWMAHALLARKIDGIPCKHIFLVLDSCFGGAMASAAPGHANEPTTPVTVAGGAGNDPAGTEPENELLTILLQFRTRRFLTSGGREYVSDGLPGHHSPFANKFLSSFQTNPQNSTFYTISELIPRVKFANPYQPIILYDSWPSNESQSEFFFFIIPPD